MNAEYTKLEKAIVISREAGKGALENFLEQQLVAQHSDIVRKLQINDSKLKDYHQVQLYYDVLIVNCLVPFCQRLDTAQCML